MLNQYTQILRNIQWRYFSARLALICMMLAASLPPSVHETANALGKIQPTLLQLAATQPNQRVGVIVQMTTDAQALEASVARLDGQITKELSLIHAFAAELPAKAAPLLAQSEQVRWISLDAPVRQSQTGTSVAINIWATTIGTSVTNGFTSSAAIVSSGLGPDGNFGVGSNVKGAFGGFNLETTPGFAISKVEIILHAYAPATLKTGQDPQLAVVVGGVTSPAVSVSAQNFNTHLGVANAGPMYVDVTSLRTWTWADFCKSLELVINQSKFAKDQYIDYDAVGFRVTSVGNINVNDTNVPTLATTLTTNTPRDTTQLSNVYNTVIRATQVWNEAPAYLQGQSMTIAVVDSGLNRSQDLAGRVTKQANFNLAYHNSTDQYGHGTFIAGLIAGNGQASQGQYVGVAPQANLINVRVSDDQGMATESDLVNGLQWVLQNKTNYKIKVVNLSLNASLMQSYNTSPVDAAVEILWFNGIVVVVSAGNNGTATLYPPANDPFVITVGAIADQGTSSLNDDVIAAFSAYGTTEAQTVKPEIVAPGVNIYGYLPRSDKSTIGQLHTANMVSPNIFRMSGTSMSAPLVSGAVALLLQDEPTLTPDQVKYRLMTTANKNWPGYDPARAGAGLLDIYAAVHAATTQTNNLGIPVSNLLTTGPNGVLTASVNWSSVNWSSVNWSSVNWTSVNWSSVNWSSVNWSSDYWENGVTSASVVMPRLTTAGDGSPVTDENQGIKTTSPQSNQIFLPLVKH
ncbi:MAG: S8 family peptidase [Caldilineaceae bacterium]